MITLLAGGTGAARFLRGLVRVIPADQLSIIVNTGDDLTWWGLHVSPDLDTITYCLADMLDPSRGWGITDDTFVCLHQMKQFGEPSWFQVGDRDLALHLHRSRLLEDGLTLTEATQQITHDLGISARVLPMSNKPVRTRVRTPKGELSFQEFFVRDRYEPDVLGVDFHCDENVTVTPDVLDVLARAEMVIIAPSNPVTSIGPFLSIAGAREALNNAPGPVLAISPIVAGKAVSGPAAKLMQAVGLEPSAVGVAVAYQPFIDLLVADDQDVSLRERIQSIGTDIVFRNTIMDDDDASEQLARAVVTEIDRPIRARPCRPGIEAESQ